MLSDNELQELKIHLIAFVDSITKEEFINCEMKYEYDDLGYPDRIVKMPNGVRTMTITIFRPDKKAEDQDDGN